MTQRPPAAAVSGPSPAAPQRPWVRLVDGAADGRRRSQGRAPTPRRVLTQFVVANLVAVALLLAGSIWASRRSAEVESLSDARTTTDVLAATLVEPVLTDAVLAGDPAAMAEIDRVVRAALRDVDLKRVKIWAPDGRIVYSDEPRLIGSVYRIGDEELATLRNGETEAEISDLQRPENRFERSAGQMLEVYRGIRTTSGRPVLFETYLRYRDATARQRDIWLRFAPISATVLLVLALVQLPLGRRMVRQLRQGEDERLRLQARAADASTDERRRIAGSLHDGIVQDLAAASYVVSGAVDQLERSPEAGRQAVTGDLKAAGAAVRDSVTALRSLLIEIYPPHLAQAGLPTALRNLATRLHPRGVDLQVEVPDDLDVPAETAALVFRVAQEALLNASRHARAQHIVLRVEQEPGAVTMEVSDDGTGFSPEVTATSTGTGHFGLHVLTDLAEAAGATLDLATAPGEGTALRLRVPLP